MTEAEFRWIEAANTSINRLETRVKGLEGTVAALVENVEVGSALTLLLAKAMFMPSKEAAAAATVADEDEPPLFGDEEDEGGVKP